MELASVPMKKKGKKNPMTRQAAAAIPDEHHEQISNDAVMAAHQIAVGSQLAVLFATDQKLLLGQGDQRARLLSLDHFQGDFQLLAKRTPVFQWPGRCPSRLNQFLRASI